jgi:SAM-dependent methyltransferase
MLARQVSPPGKEPNDATADVPPPASAVPGHRISILIPVFNEEEYIEAILERVLAARLPTGFTHQMIVVDDGSTDASFDLIQEFCQAHPEIAQCARHARNQGKGAAIRTALALAQGEYCIVQDADLEYNPQEYEAMFQPLIDGVADVVYGSRFASSTRRRVLYFWHEVANRFLTTLCNVAADLNLTDVETCYKAFRTALLRSIPLRSDRFGFDPEITIKVAKRQARIYEIPITYEGRTYEEGKKIGVSDAFAVLGAILRYWITSDLYTDSGAEILDAFAVAPRFNAWMAAVIQPFLGQRVLEIGAGMGNLTRHLARRRKRYIATDIDAEHLSRLAARLRHLVHVEVRICDLTVAGDFEPLRDAVDTVVCLNVLEHVADDLAALRNMAQTLQSGGRLIVLVPHGQSLFGSLDVVLGHVRRYSHQQLQERLEHAGLQCEQILNFNRVSRPAWYLNSRIFKSSRISRLQLHMFDRTVWLWRRLDRWLPWPPTSIIAIARKP